MQAQFPPPRGGTPTYPPHVAGPPGGYPPQGFPGGAPAPPIGPSRGYATPPPNQIPGFGAAPPAPHASHTPPQPPHAPGLSLAQPPSHTQLPPAPAAPQLPDALAGLPEDQKVRRVEYANRAPRILTYVCLGTDREGHCHDEGGGVRDAACRPGEHH